MKRTSKIVAIVLSLALLISCFCGCTITINLNTTTGSATSTVPETVVPVSTAPATTAPATTAAPETTAASSGETTAAPSGDATTAAPDTTAAPAPAGDPSTPAEILEVYKEVYKTTKATGTFLGVSNMTCTGASIDGKENGAVKSLADKFLAGTTTDQKLCPESEETPYMECDATVDDIQSATYTNNGDGTATIVIVPKETVDGKKFTSPTGKFFCVMEDVAAALASVPVVTWSEGDANSNTHLTTSGTVTVVYNIESKMMTKATYDLVTVANADHLNVLIFKDKSAELKFDYVVEFPG